MTFKEIQDAVLLDRFNETQRAAIKFAINSRYGRVWAQEPWAFKRVWVDHSLSAGEDSFTLADVGLQTVEAVFTDLPSSYRRMYSDRPELARDTASVNAGVTAAFSLVGDTIILDRSISAATDFQVLGHLAWTPLVDDTDVPLLPLEYHFALVTGAAADMLLRESDPTWQGEEKSYNDQVQEMQKAYMSQQPMARSAYPAWP
jgi:hypothetical protein